MAIDSLYPIFRHWFENGTLWCISDLHFGDKELRMGQLNRPSDENIIKNINSKVGKMDTLLILGDVGDVTYVRRLRGRKILVCGNHDLGSTNYQRKVVSQRFNKDYISKDEPLDAMKKLAPDCHYTVDEGHDFHSSLVFWEVQADNLLFDEVYTGPVMIGEKVILSHEPIPNLDWAVNLHGHIHHGDHMRDVNHYNFSGEAIGFMPINMHQWFKKGGHLSKSKSLHRITIDTATERARKRGYKMGGKK